MTPDVEEWLPVIGYEGFYEVSNRGGVRSTDRMIDHPNGYVMRRRGVPLKPATHKQGYLMVVLHREGKARTRMVHILVAEAFIGPRPEGADVCHYNDDKADNRAANLRYGTRSENVRDSVRNGTHPAARKTHCKHGHEFTEANTKTVPQSSGQGVGRACRTCINLRARARREKARQNAINQVA